MTIAPQFNPPASRHFTFKSSPQRLTVPRQLSSSLSLTYELLRSSPKLLPFVISTLQTLRRYPIAIFSFRFITLQTLCRKTGGIPQPNVIPFSFITLQTLGLKNEKASHARWIPRAIRP